MKITINIDSAQVDIEIDVATRLTVNFEIRIRYAEDDSIWIWLAHRDAFLFS